MSTALLTITDYVTDARILLQDTIAPYRYSDASLVTAMNVTLLEGRRLRPDLFVYNCDNKGRVQALQGVDATVVNIEEPFRLAFLHGMVAHALTRDQEDVQDERAIAFLGVFNSILLGRSTVPRGAPPQVGG